MTVRIVVTPDCAGTGQCVAIAPDVFALDPDGFSTVVLDTLDPDQLAHANRAAELCPMAAITVER